MMATMKITKFWQKKLKRTQKMKRHPYSWIERTNSVAISILPNTIHTFNAMLIEILMTFFKEIGKKIIKFI